MAIARSWRGLVFCLLLGACQGALAAIAVDNLDKPVSIAGQWQFKAGDNPQWAAPGLDDSGWTGVDVPGLVPQPHAEDTGMGWYRMTVQLDLGKESVQRQLGALAVTIGAVTSAYEFYAGGLKLGGVGALPPQPHIVYDQYRTYSIPSSAIDEHGKLVLALRVWRAHGGFENNAYQGPFQLGNVGELRSRAIFQSLVPNVVLTFLYLAIGLFHLLIAWRNPAMREFFWFGWFAIALAFYSFETSQLKFTLDIPYLLHKKIEYFALYIMPFLFTGTLATVVGVRLNWVGRAFQMLFLLFAAAVVAIPNFDIHFLTLRPFQLLGAVWSVGIVLVMGWLGWHGNRRARAVFAIMLLFSLAVLNFITADTSVQATTYLLHFMFAMIILFMAVVMANNYTAILARLEQAVAKRTADLQQSNRELEAAVAVRSQFLANMSHELRTPMNAIIGLTHLGLKTELTEQQRGYLTTVEQSAQALGGIIESIFDFSKLEAGELECESKPFSLPKVLANLAAVYGPQAEAKGLDITFDQDPAIPSHLVGDATRLGQILGHLASNAIKFTEQGQISVAVRIKEQSHDRVTLEFAVADTGPGLDPGLRDHLFESFSQADNTNTRAHGGAGLGLAISQALAGLMDGVIEVESEQGAGSTFRLILPLAIAPEAETEDLDEPVPAQELDLAPIHGAQVLLVDDSEINLQVASELLSHARLHVDTALDGQQAVDAVKAKQYDCILMDIQMPVMDGYTATRTIRALGEAGSLPILAMTANVLPEDRARAKEAGVDDHIPKPIDPQELYSKLLRWIEPGEREPFEAAPEAVASAQELPEILPGIAVADGMKRVGGNAKLYVKLLADVRNDYATAAASIEELFRAGDIDGASQLGHKLRGIANNLGATDVGSCAEKIELGLKAQGTVDDGLFASLAAKLATLVESIDQLQQLTTSEAGASQLTAADIEQLLARLEQEVADSNPAAEETVEQLLQGVDEADALYTALAATRDAIDIYDFPGAVEHLATARQA